MCGKIYTTQFWSGPAPQLVPAAPKAFSFFVQVLVAASAARLSGTAPPLCTRDSDCGDGDGAADVEAREPARREWTVLTRFVTTARAAALSIFCVASPLRLWQDIHHLSFVGEPFWSSGGWRSVRPFSAAVLGYPPFFVVFFLAQAFAYGTTVTIGGVGQGHGKGAHLRNDRGWLLLSVSLGVVALSRPGLHGWNGAPVVAVTFSDLSRWVHVALGRRDPRGVPTTSTTSAARFRHEHRADADARQLLHHLDELALRIGAGEMGLVLYLVAVLGWVAGCWLCPVVCSRGDRTSSPHPTLAPAVDLAATR